jgi:hypothetical protein
MAACALSQTRQAPLTAAEQATALKAIRQIRVELYQEPAELYVHANHPADGRS